MKGMNYDIVNIETEAYQDRGEASKRRGRGSTFADSKLSRGEASASRYIRISLVSIYHWGNRLSVDRSLFRFLVYKVVFFGLLLGYLLASNCRQSFNLFLHSGILIIGSTRSSSDYSFYSQFVLDYFELLHHPFIVTILAARQFPVYSPPFCQHLIA